MNYTYRANKNHNSFFSSSNFFLYSEQVYETALRKFCFNMHCQMHKFFQNDVYLQWKYCLVSIDISWLQCQFGPKIPLRAGRSSTSPTWFHITFWRQKNWVICEQLKGSREDKNLTWSCKPIRFAQNNVYFRQYLERQKELRISLNLHYLFMRTPKSNTIHWRTSTISMMKYVYCNSFVTKH